MAHGEDLRYLSRKHLQKLKKKRVKERISNRSTAELRCAADMTAKFTAYDKVTSLSPHQALPLYVDLDLSERKYKLLRSVINGVHKNCFPSLYTLNLTKKELLPTQITANEISACVNLEELLQLTARSLLKIGSLEGNEFKLICKRRFDGSSGHSQYKQVFTNPAGTDKYVFLIATVPLKLLKINMEKKDV